MSLRLGQSRRMNDHAWGTSNIEHRTPNVEVGATACGEAASRRDLADAGHPTVEYDGQMAAVADRRYMEIKASQARSDLIKATIIFFGLDSDCPCHSDNLCA